MEALNYIPKTSTKKFKKKAAKKSTQIINIRVEEPQEDETSLKPSKKRRSRYKQNTVNSTSRTEMTSNNTRFRDDSLKLFTMTKNQKSQQPSKQKIESRKKSRKNGNTTTINTVMSKRKTKPIVDSYGDSSSSSSEDIPIVRTKILKKKKTNSTVKKRISSSFATDTKRN